MQVQKEAIRESILSASLEEFYQFGYDKASMGAIAQRCKISKSNLYRYFESKEAIYEVIVSPVRREFRNAVAYLTDEKMLTYPRNQMVEMIVNYLSVVLIKHRKEVVIISHSKQCKEDTELVEEIQGKMVQSFSTIYKKGLSPKFACILAGMLLDGIIKIVESSEQEEEIKKQILAIFRYHASGIYVLSHE